LESPKRIGSGHSEEPVYPVEISYETSLEIINSSGKIAISREGRLGDMVMLQPSVRQLVKTYPNKEFVVVSDERYKFIYRNIAEVVGKVPNGFTTIDLDSFVERHSGARYINRIDLFGYGCGINHLYSKQPRLGILVSKWEECLDLLSANKIGNKPIIGIVPKSVSMGRSWGDVNPFIASIADSGYATVTIDFTSIDIRWPYRGSASDSTTRLMLLPELEFSCAMVMCCKLIITPDTGMMHVAAALNTPFIATYVQKETDSKDPQVRTKYYRNYSVVTPDDSGEIKVDTVYRLVKNVMDGEQLGRDIFSRSTLTVERGATRYQFVKGESLWVQEPDATDLLLGNNFYTEDKEDTINPKIVWIIPDVGLGGAERHTLELLKSLKYNKWDNTVVVTRTQNRDVLRGEFSEVSKVKVCDESNESALRDLITNEKPDLLVWITSRSSDMSLRSMFVDIPCISIVHAQTELAYVENTFYIFTSAAALMSSGIDIDEGYATIIPNGVDLTKFSSGANVRDKLGISRNDFVALYAGRVDADKNVPQMVEVCERIPGMHLIVAGTGNDEHTPKELVEKWGLQDRVHFRGFVSPDGISNLMRSSDCLLLASNSESMPLVVLEAMAAMLPVVSAAVGDVPILLGDNERGYLFEQGNVDEFTACVESVIADRRTAETRSRVALEYVRANHALDDMCWSYKSFIGASLEQLTASIIVISSEEDILGPTIESVLADPYPNIEVIVTGENENEEVDRWVRRDGRVRNLLVDGTYPLADYLNHAVDNSHGNTLFFLRGGEKLNSGIIDRVMSVEVNPLLVGRWATKDGVANVNDISMSSFIVDRSLIRAYQEAEDNTYKSPVFYREADALFTEMMIWSLAQYVDWEHLDDIVVTNVVPVSVTPSMLSKMKDELFELKDEIRRLWHNKELVALDLEKVTSSDDPFEKMTDDYEEELSDERYS
jgi:glycosyltransferase involved in cell wall biosynthesis